MKCNKNCVIKQAHGWANLQFVVKPKGWDLLEMRRIVTQRSDIAQAHFMVQVENMSANIFIWVDETSSDKRNALRKYAYSLWGVTPINYCLYTSGRRISAIYTNSTRGVEDVYLAEGGFNSDMFCDFIEKCLLPVLMSFNGSNLRSIVVIDNASIHHIDKVVQLCWRPAVVPSPIQAGLKSYRTSCCLSKYCTHYLIMDRLNSCWVGKCQAPTHPAKSNKALKLQN